MLVFALAISALSAYSQTTENTDNSDSPLVKGAAQMMSPVPGQEEQSREEGEERTITEIWCADIDDEPTRNVCWESYRSSFDYYIKGHKHRTKVFAWQFNSGRIIFVVVLMLVAIGIYFAWVQFKLDTGVDKQDTRKGEGKEHTVELSTSGIKVSSPVLGVIILVLSLAFFYLYLVFVYPIAEIF